MTEYPIIGMSPGNSYFKDETVKHLLQIVVEKFGKTAILIADVPAISTYCALGYPKNRAWRDKALPQSNNLKNKVSRAMVALGYKPEQVRMINWGDEVENNSEYLEKYNEVKELYQNNSAFKKSADSATGEVLENSNKTVSDLQSAIDVAVHYLLSEIAFMEFASEYLSVDRAVYIYHKNWSVYQEYISGIFDSKERKNMAFMIC